jgi:hypothetical protein
LSSLYSLLPFVKNVAYLLPENLGRLFEPFNSEKLIKEEDPNSKKDVKKNGSGIAQRKKMLALKKKRANGEAENEKLCYFKEFTSSQPDNQFSLYLCQKKEVFPIFKVRRARVEDCDDLVPMFKKQNVKYCSLQIIRY